MNVEYIEKLVHEISLPIANELGLEIVDVEFVREHNEWYLRVYIDKEGGVTIDDCTSLSRVLSNKLDEVDPIDFSYYLEVSSPGIERPLKKDRDFERNVGKKIKIKLFEPIEGKKTIEGTLLGLEEKNILISINDNILKIDRTKVSNVKLCSF
ncbi:ribosome maturation factor RimP [Caloramator sp. E03]|uniref:ribosome maturation factor RimP n=1 Tax=Caloramator sp. E03 TaxID=2576307 RepID=UPI001110646D|nr:ribosome maturation factor RimP [Caloramator sp. E03]QCX32276.1 ribosome maturation factor RimP [Caloramator sp. E03]